jgi:hypothetical protein
MHKCIYILPSHISLSFQLSLPCPAFSVFYFIDVNGYDGTLSLSSVLFVSDMKTNMLLCVLLVIISQWMVTLHVYHNGESSRRRCCSYRMYYKCMKAALDYFYPALLCLTPLAKNILVTSMVPGTLHNGYINSTVIPVYFSCI